jgi:hypothetical protein
VDRLSRRVAAPAVACLALFAGACNKGPAESALASADRELAAVRVDLERYAPEELASLDAATAKARAALGEGRYTDALRTAQALPEQIRVAAAAASAKKEQRITAWNALSAALPGAVQALADRVATLAGASSLPRGMTQETLASAQAELGAVTREWNEATAAFQGGDVPRALELARDVEARTEALAVRLGLATAPVPPAGASASR